MGKTNQKPIPCELVSPDAEAIARELYKGFDPVWTENLVNVIIPNISRLIAERNQLTARVTELEAALAKYTDPVRGAGNDMEPNEYA